ncbi:hypothetical protein [Streptomyces guryensis]|uniref:Fucose permease n=1 Tax=Streptomyces guryensis TaxID=2886947 RepID=A0A9Q3VWJ3_9ACTN|nr:hypothetical protein [Streptomyces guryensis]MCD9878944.1 hypothetical protein [Streptomyces guryensis]
MKQEARISVTSSHAVDSSREIRTIRAAYLLTSFPLTSWYSQVDAVQSRLGVDDGRWGLLLLVAPLVTLCSMRVYVSLVPRHLAHIMLNGALVGIAVDVFFIGRSRSQFALVVCLVALGLLNGVCQVESNSRAHAVEVLSGRQIFTSCHGYFSIGVLAAGLTAFGTAQLHMSFVAHFSLVLIVGMAGVWMFRVRPLPPASEVQVGSSSETLTAAATPRSPRLPLVALMVLAFVLLGIESSVNTWHAKFVETGLHLPGYGGAAYAAYAAGGLVVRFSGDAIRRRAGALTLFTVVGPLSVCCLLWALLDANAVSALLAFLTLGIALGIAYPDVLKLGAELSTDKAAERVSKIITAGTLGVLLSNPFMGAVSEWLSVEAGFELLAVLLLVTAATLAVLRVHRKFEG